jgi:hypothetical protein
MHGWVARCREFVDPGAPPPSEQTKLKLRARACGHKGEGQMGDSGAGDEAESMWADRDWA